MPEPTIPPEANEPSGRTPESQPRTAPNPDKVDPRKDPSDAGTAPPSPIDSAI